MAQTNNLKRHLSAGDILFGAWVSGDSPANAEVLALQGFDFLIVDLEHGPGDIRLGLDVLRAVRPFGTPCVIRAPSNDPVFIKKILDVGANALMIPSVETAEEANAAVRACKYPPEGTRGYAAPLVRASDYGHDAAYMRTANEEILLIVQIESAAAVERAAEICAVAGVDVPFLGVNDMAGSIGRLEQLDKPDVRNLVSRAEAAMRASGKPFGGVPSAAADWRRLIESGYRLIPTASDIGLLRDAASDCMRERKQYVAERTKPAPPAWRAATPWLA
jgi:4-hydroxy-2-oxoheptanedioate aldolase